MKVKDLLPLREIGARKGPPGDKGIAAQRDSFPPHPGHIAVAIRRPSWSCLSCGSNVPPAEEDEKGTKHFVCPSCDSFSIVPKQPGETIASPQAETFTPSNRDFLPRPGGKENNPDLWDAWAPFFDWLIEHHPNQFHAICAAEEMIRDLERTGVSGGPEYNSACLELFRQFEKGRRLKMKAGTKIWFQ